MEFIKNLKTNESILDSNNHLLEFFYLLGNILLHKPEGI